MPTEKTVLAYTFAELSDDAKDKARNWFREGIDVDQWSDSETEDAANVGIKITGFDIGRGSYIDGTVEDTEGTAHAIVKDHGEECDTYKLAVQYLADRDAAIDEALKDEETDESALDEKLDELGAEFTRAILEEYLCSLRNEYEYRMSDEAVDEDIEANEYLFTEDGSRSATM